MNNQIKSFSSDKIIMSPINVDIGHAHRVDADKTLQFCVYQCIRRNLKQPFS